MTKKEYTLSDRTCFLYQDEAATHLLIQPIALRRFRQADGKGIRLGY